MNHNKFMMLHFLNKSSNNNYSSSKLLILLKGLNQGKLLQDSKSASIIENLRLLTEYLVWGEKNDHRFFELFLEHKALESILSLIKKYK